MNNNIHLYNMDCMAFMKQCQSEAFDLLIADPPYFSNAYSIITPGGNLTTTGIQRRKYSKPHWEPPTEEYFEEMFRVSKQQIIWGINYYSILNPGCGRIVWDKCNDNGTSFSNCEIAYCSMLKHVKIFRFLWNGMCQGNPAKGGTVMQGNKKLNEKRIHPTQKPIALYQWIYNHFAIKLRNQYHRPVRILDPYLGSASSAIAVLDFDIDFYGLEIDKGYFDAAQRRFEEHNAQMRFQFFNNQEQ